MDEEVKDVVIEVQETEFNEKEYEEIKLLGEIGRASCRERV